MPGAQEISPEMLAQYMDPSGGGYFERMRNKPFVPAPTAYFGVPSSGGMSDKNMDKVAQMGAGAGMSYAFGSPYDYASGVRNLVTGNIPGAAKDFVSGFTGGLSKLFADGGMASGGGLSTLGGYSDGGRLLRGPGDGVSDSIPAQIGNSQPARLADGEFVVPARIVSELGNGSTEAGAKQLYKMLDRVQKARGKTTGKNKVAHNTNAAKYLPA
jgi:hypothetical protein